MKLSGPLSCFVLLAPVWAGQWLGIGKPRPVPAPAAASAPAPAGKPANPAPAPKTADTTILSHRVSSIPAGSIGTFLGTLEGVRCFNCVSDQVLLNLGDSVSTESAVLALHIDVWNAIERPLRDKRMYDFDNRCFYFGYKEVDTAFVGGEWTEIRLHEIPCYPYVKRTLYASPSSMAVPQMEEAQSPSGAGAAKASAARAPADSIPSHTAMPAVPPAAFPTTPRSVPHNASPADIVLEPSIE